MSSGKASLDLPTPTLRPERPHTSSSPAPSALRGRYMSVSTAIEVAVNPQALITNECITVTSAMRKNARWAQSSVAAILGGGMTDGPGASTPTGSGGTGTPGRNSPAPGAELAKRKNGVGEKGSVASGSTAGKELGIDIGLASRWGLRGKKGKSIQDNPLIAAFSKLRGDMNECRDIRTYDTPALLHPFLQVIRSSSTSGPITSLALMAITKFFSYNIITPYSPRLSLAMHLLSSAITHCRFEASDSAQDEVVLLRILKLMEGMMAGPGGELLGDESVCEMMETGLSMCCQMRLSEVLRRSAEMSMVIMCQVLFERLKHLGSGLEDADGDYAESTAEETLKVEPAVNGDLPQTAAPEEGHGEPSAEIVPPTEDDKYEDSEIKPYSLPSIRELFRVLVSLLDPSSRQHTDTMRVMALRMIDVAFEVAGSSITMHPSLANLAHDDLCRYLFQLVRSDAMAILQESLRVTGTLLATSRGGLKLQQELFLSYVVECLHPNVEIPREIGIDPYLYEGVPQGPKNTKQALTPTNTGSGRSTPVPVKERQKLGMEGGSRRPDARESMVECVGALCRIPSFVVELYVNYDCDVDRSNLCEDVIGFLSRNAFPDSATWSTTNVPPLCLDALLGIIGFIADRLDDETRTEGLMDSVELQKQRAKKEIIIQGTTKYNENPKKGIAYLAQHNIIENVDSPEAIAKFLRGTTRVSKKVLGEYLTKKSNEGILDAFLSSFDFSGKRVDEALRDMLESFRLPGESALIERLVSSFSEKYFNASEQEDVADKDAVFVLSYAIIMLNTDQHNPTIKSQNRMTLLQFSRNLRGVNNGKDFTPEYLEAIYNTIKTNEIILPEEHDSHAFEYAWKELLLKTHSASDLIICNTNLYDAATFTAIWRPVVATLSYVFMSATDDAVFTRVITGFNQCAQIAAKYNLTECFDRIVNCLSLISTLAPELPLSTKLNTEVQVNGNGVTVSEMAVKFGRDFKAQLATVVLFRIVTGKEGVIRDGWIQLVRIWLNLFTNALIPPFFLTDQNGFELPAIPLQTPAIVIERNPASKDVGLFATFSSYLSSYAADDPPEPSDEELENTLCTVDCVNSCFLGDVFSNIMGLDMDSLKSLVVSLLSTIPEGSTPVVIIKHEAPASNGPPVSNKRDSSYNPAIVYVLELTTCLVLRDAATVLALGPELAESLQGIVNEAKNAHPIVVARSIYYLLMLLKSSHEHTFLRTHVILHNLATMDKNILDNCSEPIAKGLSACAKASPSLKSEMINSPNFWSLLRMLATNTNVAGLIFDILMSVVEESALHVTADNYIAVITLLNDFATAGSVGAQFEQSQDKSSKRAKPVKAANRPQGEIVDRGVTAVKNIYGLTPRVTALIEQSHLERTEAWSTYWSPIFQALSSQCVNPCREVRHHAFSSLQRSLLSPELASHDHKEWTAIFGDVLFPLITTLLKPEIYQGDTRGMSETRVQAATLLCKIFLHYLVMLSEWEGMLALWLKILDVMDRLMNSGQGDHLDEAVPESLKNILLVMMNGGYLVRPEEKKEKDDTDVDEKSAAEDEKRKELWVETWKRLDRFLPGLYQELFPEPTSTNEKGKEKE